MRRLDICKEIPQAHDMASARLLVSKALATDESTKTLGKRKCNDMQPRYVVCMQCEAEYEVTKNHNKACVWHSAEFSLPILDSFLGQI